MKRFAIMLGLSVAAYLLYMQLVFPGHIAWPVPFHNDMYWAAAMGIDHHLGFLNYLQYPRPVFYETYLLAGQFGLEGSLVFLTAILLCDFALALLLLERFVLKKALPWWLALGTILIMMAGPGFFAQPAFVVGYHLTMLFTMLGIFVWEEWGTKAPIPSLIGTGVAFAIGSLAYEGFAPAMFAYGAFAAWRNRRRPALATALIALPLLAVAIAYVDGRMLHSPFVGETQKDGPYYVDLSPSSLLATANYYYRALVDPAVFVLLAASLAGLAQNRRFFAAACCILVGLALYLPYVILPNHLGVMYLWAPIPVLALIVPLAWIDAPPSPKWIAANVALIVALTGAIVFQTTQYPGERRDFRNTLEANRAMIAALRAHRVELAAAHNVLVRGLIDESNPWAHNADAIPAIVPFAGRWSVETEPGGHEILPQADARPVEAVRDLAKYDLVLDFDRNGTLIRTFAPKERTPVNNTVTVRAR